MSGLTEEAYQALKAKSQPVQEAAPPQATIEAPTEQTEATTEEKVASQPNDGESQEVVKDEPVAESKSWDEPVETKVEAQPEDFTWVSDLVGEVKTKDELKTRVSELKSKLKTYEENPVAGIPDEVSEVVKIAKTGGWEEAKNYLATQLIDYSKLNPLDEFERDFIQRAEKNPRYFTDGKYDHDKVLADVDAIPEAQRHLIGQQIIDAEATLAERQRVAIKARSEAKRTEAEKSLAQSTKQLSEILPLDTYGIKFEPRHSSEIYEGIVNSKLTKKHLGVSYDDLVRVGADMKAITRSITLAEKGEKMIAFKSDNKATEVKKELLNKVQNVQLNSTSTPPNPETPDAKKKSPLELMKEYQQQQAKIGL